MGTVPRRILSTLVLTTVAALGGAWAASCGAPRGPWRDPAAPEPARGAPTRLRPLLRLHGRAADGSEWTMYRATETDDWTFRLDR